MQTMVKPQSNPRSNPQSIESFILKNPNPFDPSTFRPGNFWEETYQPCEDTQFIHKDALIQIQSVIEQVQLDHVSRTLLLLGDKGNGKSHLLARLKESFNDESFFVYVDPWPSSAHIWRHTLRKTIDSLVRVAGNSDQPQLVTWLKGILHSQSRAKYTWLIGERNRFIQNMEAAYPSGIYQAKSFFGVLYALTQPELYASACQWLKGDDLDDESLRKLHVKSSIVTEDAAQKILGNFGKISQYSQPITICFDQLDNIPKLHDGNPDYQPLMDLNSSIHNERYKGFVVILSVITHAWQEAKKRIQSADLDRISCIVQLSPITLEQAAALWASKLKPLHQQLKPRPRSSTAPLDPQYLDAYFRQGRTDCRSALQLGQFLIDYFKRHQQFPDLRQASTQTNTESGLGKKQSQDKTEAHFQLVWDEKLKRAQQSINRVQQFASPELIQRLREVLEAIGLPKVQTSFLPKSVFSAHSLSYGQSASVGVVWSEEQNMTSFYHIMNACEKLLDKSECSQLYFIRVESVGKGSNKGHKLYQKLMQNSKFRHLTVDLQSLAILDAYHGLVNAACGGELVVGTQELSLPDLQQLTRSTKILKDSHLLQELCALKSEGRSKTKPESRTAKPTDPKPENPESENSESENPKPGKQAATPPTPPRPPIPPSPASINPKVRPYLLNIMTTQHLMGRQILIQNLQSQFSDVSPAQLDQLIQQLCTEQRLRILDPNAKLEEQLICLVPE